MAVCSWPGECCGIKEAPNSRAPPHEAEATVAASPGLAGAQAELVIGAGAGTNQLTVPGRQAACPAATDASGKPALAQAKSRLAYQLLSERCVWRSSAHSSQQFSRQSTGGSGSSGGWTRSFTLTLDWTEEEWAKKLKVGQCQGYFQLLVLLLMSFVSAPLLIFFLINWEEILVQGGDYSYSAKDAVRCAFMLTVMLVKLAVAWIFVVYEINLPYGYPYVVVIWLYTAVSIVWEIQLAPAYEEYFWHGGDHYDWTMPASYLLLVLKLYLSYRLFWARLATVEQSMRRSLGTRCLSAMLHVLCLITTVMIANLVAETYYGYDYVGVYIGGFHVLFILVFAWATVIGHGLVAGYCVALLRLQRVVRTMDETPLAGEAQEARTYLLKQLLGFFANVLLTGCFAIVSQIVDPYEDHHIFYSAMCADEVGDVVMFVLLTGIHRVLYVRGPRGMIRALQCQRGQREAFLLAPAACADVAWQQKVEELAGRGFTLRVLLEFWKGLGRDYMEHFVPSVHTTTDVVRHAIVPLSSHAGSSMAELLTQGQKTRPEKLITHTWSNLFRDSVAAIFADALGETEFSIIAALLELRVGQLEKMLEAEGVLDNTVWFCPFSVNQHAGICAQNPLKTKDPVSGIEHPVCSCGAQKFFNSSPPLRDDGRSCPCEMNKFNDVMKSLAANPSFEQVVAVDSSCEVFSRAWCASEIAEAHLLGVRTRVVIAFRSQLAKHGGKLRGLKVQNMQASRPEDVQEILASIPDKEAFNGKLQYLLFDARMGCLPQWQAQDALQRMRRTGRLVRWDDLGGNDPSFWTQKTLRFD